MIGDRLHIVQAKVYYYRAFPVITANDKGENEELLVHHRRSRLRTGSCRLYSPGAGSLGAS
jgi:hypothetical protein